MVLISCYRDTQEWALVKLAADMSKQVYDDKLKTTPEVVVHHFLRLKTDMKPTTISTVNHGNTKILVVAIRGTVTTDDWLLNVNGDPIVEKALDENFRWHQGFVRMALTMEKQIAKFVWDVASRNDQLEQVVFTGHSAGGAIAQILYALSMRLDSAIAQAIRGMYVRVEDITADRLQASRLFTV
jgi:hypothetical protein